MYVTVFYLCDCLFDIAPGLRLFNEFSCHARKKLGPISGIAQCNYMGTQDSIPRPRYTDTA
jgi:hypothetical protein